MIYVARLDDNPKGSSHTVHVSEPSSSAYLASRLDAVEYVNDLIDQGVVAVPGSFVVACPDGMVLCAFVIPVNKGGLRAS